MSVLEKDPYLVKGMPCEVLHGIMTPTTECMYFLDYWDTSKELEPRFSKRPNRAQGLTIPEYYRPLNTEWDYAPDWAVCSTVNTNGKIFFWRGIPEISGNNWVFNEGLWMSLPCGICPDKFRYEGEAWKTSLRMRPVWAPVKNKGEENV